MAELIALRLIHIVGGIFWVGAIVFIAAFLMPALVEAGPAAGPVMGGLRRRHLLTVLPVVALLTLLSGARLMWLTSGGFAGAWFATNHGRTYTVGAIAAVIAFFVGVLVIRPTAARMGSLGEAIAQAADGAVREGLAKELSGVRLRNARANQIVMVLLIVAAIAMAIARYMG